MNSDTDTHHSPIIIAIDGFSSSGKSSMARRLAHDIGYRYIDSGAMYRAVTLYALRHGMVAPDGSIDTAPLEAALPSIEIDFAVTPQGQATLLNGEDVERQIRSMEVSAHVSPVAAIPAVRRALVALQQAFGRQKGIVMDGRDIGTTVFPHAEMKVYVNASAETRARRRYKELEEKGALGSTTFEQVLANVVERDRIDTTRAESPLRQAPDAILLDNSSMTIDGQNEWLLSRFNEITGRQQ